MQSPRSQEIDPLKKYNLFCNSDNPNTLVMLKDIEHMGYFHQSCVHDDGSGQQVFKFFPNYFIFNNVKMAHKQKVVLRAMMRQKTDQQIMIREFCNLARKCYPDDHEEIGKLEKFFSKQKTTARDFLNWYSKQCFFYRLLNRLLRAGKGSAQIYYGHYFIKNISKAITLVYSGQKNMVRISQDFKCYRGAYFSQKQLEELQGSVGKHIETLGFLSTSLQKTVAFGFLQNGNTLVEIDVSPRAAKDEELDLGYAYLDQQLSDQAAEEEIIFNLLSSFQIKSVGKLNFGSREVWHIKLEYGVTYQMMRKYKQNMISLERGPAQYQLILAILSHQNRFRMIQNQESCLIEQDLADECIQMYKTKIDLYKSNPKLQEFVLSQQIQLYGILRTRPKFQGKQQKFIEDMESKWGMWNNRLQKSEPVLNQFLDLKNKVIMSLKYLRNQDYLLLYILTRQWMCDSEKLYSSPEMQKIMAKYPSFKEQMEYMHTYISICQVIAKLDICEKNGNELKLKQVLSIAEKWLQWLLKKNGRYDDWYSLLNRSYLYYSLKLQTIDFEEYLEKIQEDIPRKNAIEPNESNQFQAKVIPVYRQAHQLLQSGQWTEAVKLCAEFRDKQYKQDIKQDGQCFHPVIAYLNKKNMTLPKKLKLLEICFGVNHPQNSGFLQQLKQTRRRYIIQQQLCWTLHVQCLGRILKMKPHLLINQLWMLKQKLMGIFTKETTIWITHECLIVNTLRMLGKYEQANHIFAQLKHLTKTGNHPEYYSLLNLGQFEERE